MENQQICEHRDDWNNCENECYKDQKTCILHCEKNNGESQYSRSTLDTAGGVEAFWKAVRKYRKDNKNSFSNNLSNNFSNFIFPVFTDDRDYKDKNNIATQDFLFWSKGDKVEFKGTVLFCGTTFEENADFSFYTFKSDNINDKGECVNFKDAIFKKGFSFSSSLFEIDLDLYNIKSENKNTNNDFSFAKFNRELRIDNSTLLGKKTDFKEVEIGENFLLFKKYKEFTTLENAQFINTKFKGEADFKSAKLIGDFSFYSTKFSKTVNFTFTIFDYKIREDRIEIKPIYGNPCNQFEDTIFEKKVDFESAKFLGDFLFKNITFHDLVSFRDVVFDEFIQEGVNFEKIIFEKGLSIGGYFQKEIKSPISFFACTFNEQASFSNESPNEKLIFTEKFEFIKCTTNNIISFNYTQFKKDVNLNNSNFNNYTHFEETVFEKKSNFKYSRFNNSESYLFFTKTIFKYEAKLQNIQFSENCYFSECEFINISLLNSFFINSIFSHCIFPNIKNNKGENNYILFDEKSLTINNKSSDYEKIESVYRQFEQYFQEKKHIEESIKFAKRKFYITELRIKNTIKDRNEQLSSLEFLYSELKKMYDGLLLYPQAEKFYKKEYEKRIEMLAHLNFYQKIIKWIFWYKWISEFNTNPNKTFWWIILTPLFFSVIYSLFLINWYDSFNLAESFNGTLQLLQYSYSSAIPFFNLKAGTINYDNIIFWLIHYIQLIFSTILLIVFSLSLRRKFKR